MWGWLVRLCSGTAAVAPPGSPVTKGSQGSPPGPAKTRSTSCVRSKSQRSSITTADGPSKRKRSRIPAAVREQVWNRYVGREVGLTKCPVCLERDLTPFHFHCGHIVADAAGGATTVENLRPICGACNLSMGTMNMGVYQQTYHPDCVRRVPTRMEWAGVHPQLRSFWRRWLGTS